MAGNKPGVKLQRNKARSTASVSPARSQLSDDASNAAPDLSVLRKSIGTSITGFPQARNVFDAGTHEIKQLLSNECDIIYECRVCRNLFRSLANFISHKRIYCCETFKTSIHPHFNNNNFMNDDIIAIIQHEEEYLNFVKNKKKANYKNGISVEYGKKNHPKDLTSIVEKLKCRENSKLIPDSTDPKYPNKIYAKLQSISGTKNAVYQNIFCDNAVPSDLMKDQIAELDRLISLNEAVLGPDGKLISQNVSSSNDALDEKLDSNSQDDLFCNICKISFSTQKTLKFHMKHKHAENRLVYPCLDCTDTFSNPWSVYRHLLKVHRKSATHIRKLRESIQNKAFKLDSYSIENMKSVEVPVDSITEQQRVNQENQAWIDNLERDGDIPRCGGCGKKFERRAALSSHRQTCQLRKSAQNKLNSNQRKIGVKSAIKDVDDSVLLEPFVKISRIDKPIEKRIEIKIRKDYNKSSPINIRTSSPADEDSTTESMEHSETPNVGFVLGESECNFLNSIRKIYLNAETVKDCDDANVDENSEKNSDTNNSIEINEDSNFVDDSNTINFESTCQDESLKDANKASGQREDDSLLEFSSVTKPESEYNSSEKLLDESSANVGNEFGENTEDKYECDYCSIIFLEKYRMQKHIARHLLWIKFKCKLCGVKSCNAAQYKRHMKQQHKKRKKRTSPKKSKIKSSEETALYPVNENVHNYEENTNLSKDMYKNLEKDEPDKNVDIGDDSKLIEPKIGKVTKKRQSSSIKSLQIKNKHLFSSDSHEASHSTSTEVDLTNDFYFKTDSEELGPYSPIFKIGHEKFFETVIQEGNFKKHNQHIASSESYTVRRPVRNRVKHFDKDFEYDSSFLPKAKIGHKTNSIVRILSAKPVLKRKQFLQNENEKAVEMIPPKEVIQMNQKEETSLANQKEETQPMNLQEEPRLIEKKEEMRLTNLKEETLAIQKEEIKSAQLKKMRKQKNSTHHASLQQPYQGALHTISLKAYAHGKAMMRQKQNVMTRRYTPPFIRTQFRIPPILTETQKLTESFTPIHPSPISHRGVSKKKTVPLVKTNQLKYLQSTPLKTSKKSFSEEIQQKIGLSALTPQTAKLQTQKKVPLIYPPSKKKKMVPLQTLPITKMTNLSKVDHEALSNSNEKKFINEELIMIPQQSCKKNAIDKEHKSSENTLSILPANGKTKSDFVNISLKELKNLQKEKDTSSDNAETKSPENELVFKNLEDNNEIVISKLNQVIQTDNSIESQNNPQCVDILEVIPEQSRSRINKKIVNLNKLLKPENKSTFPQSIITTIVTIDHDEEFEETIQI